ncbi:MAG: hypothetical protein IKV76_10600 [Clostridia bacterium]|nr:hypothetical protein [Clostridia bacterium]
MIEKKLEALFNELNEDEIKTVVTSEINTECDIDPTIYARITANVSKKISPADIVVVSSRKKQTMGKRLKAILAAAAIFIILTIGAGAAYQFMIPDGLNEELALNDMHIKTVVDTEKADENSVRTMQKTVTSNGYTVTFEAIVDGYVIRPKFIENLMCFSTTEEIREDKIYAVMTITRDDGKSVLEPDGYMPACFCCDGFSFNFDILVKGYAPNSAMFSRGPWYHEENNILYYLCDISDAAKFADHELSIIIFDEPTLDGTIARMDKNGDFYIVDTYDRMAVIFDIDLDDSLADPEAVRKDMEERPYIYETNPDYTIADEMIAKNEELKKVDLSYAIGNHRWYGWNPLQFGDIPYSETFIELFADKVSLTETDVDTLNNFISEEEIKFDKVITAEFERIAGKTMDELTDEEYIEISDEVNEFIDANKKIKADLLRENFNFVKLPDGSEYCYIYDFIFLYIPAGSEYAQIVIVYGDAIVISIECTLDNLRNNPFCKNSEIDYMLPGVMYSYWYLFGTDEDSSYTALYNEEELKSYYQTCIRSEQDAIFYLISEFTYFDGTVEVLR